MWSILPKIKVALGVAASFAIAILYTLFRVEKADKEVAEAKAEEYKRANDENSQTIESIKDEKKVIDDSHNLSDDDVVNSLLKRARDRNED